MQYFQFSVNGTHWAGLVQKGTKYDNLKIHKNQVLEASDDNWFQKRGLPETIGPDQTVTIPRRKSNIYPFEKFTFAVL